VCRHRLSLDGPFRGEFSQAMQRLLFLIGVEDKHAIVTTDRPVLPFDLYARFGRGLVETVCAGRGLLDIPGALLSEFDECNVSCHRSVLSFKTTGPANTLI